MYLLEDWFIFHFSFYIKAGGRMLRTLFAIISAVFVVLRLPPPPSHTILRHCIVDVCTWQWLVMAVDCPFIFVDWKEILLLWCPFLRACNLFALAALGIPCPLGGQEVWACIPLNGCLPPILPGIIHWGLCTDNLMMGLISQPCNPWAPQIPYPIDQWGVLIGIYFIKNHFILYCILKICSKLIRK